MASPISGQAYQTYQGISNKEDLEDAFYMISPTEVPFLTMCERTKATSTKHEWTTDALADAAQNAQIEGDDAANGTSTPGVRYWNYIQNASKYAVVTDNQNAVSSAGDINTMAHQVAKRMAELKRDMENDLTGKQAMTAGSAASAATFAGLEAWLWGSGTANVNTGTGNGGGASTLACATAGNSITYGSTEATTPSFSSSTGLGTALTDASSTSAFCVGGLKTVIANCWKKGGDPQIIMVGGGTKQVVSGFTGIATLYREAGQTAKGTAIIGAADLYVSDFGEHRVIPNRFQRNRTVFVLDMDYFAVAYLRSISQKEIARTGSSQKRFIDVAYTLVCRNPLASGKISDVTA